MSNKYHFILAEISNTLCLHLCQDGRGEYWEPIDTSRVSGLGDNVGVEVWAGDMLRFLGLGEVKHGSLVKGQRHTGYDFSVEVLNGTSEKGASPISGFKEGIGASYYRPLNMLPWVNDTPIIIL